MAYRRRYGGYRPRRNYGYRSYGRRRPYRAGNRMRRSYYPTRRRTYYGGRRF